MLNIQSLIKYPIPTCSEYSTYLKQLVLKQIEHYSQDGQNELDRIVYMIYGLDNDEIKEIESCDTVSKSVSENRKKFVNFIVL